MALNPKWTQALLNYETTLAPPDHGSAYRGSDSGSIGRALIDGALVVYDPDSPPTWLESALSFADEDGATPDDITNWEPRRAPRPGEYTDPQPSSVHAGPMRADQLITCWS